MIGNFGVRPPKKNKGLTASREHSPFFAAIKPGFLPLNRTHSTHDCQLNSLRPVGNLITRANVKTHVIARVS